MDIAIVTIDRPEALNALNSTVITELDCRWWRPAGAATGDAALP